MVDIYDWNDLDAVRNDLTADYVLKNDLDEDTAGYTGIGDDFQPIGVGLDGPNGNFNGTFDGQGYAIKDLVVSVDASYVGLFGSVGRNSTQTAIIERLSVSGSVTNTATGGQSTGGLAGFVDGENGPEIRNCAIHVDVTASGNLVGGAIGLFNGNTLTNCYSTGSVAGDDEVGGLVGDNRSEIKTCYTVGSVTGNSNVGGLTGENSGTVTDSYWDTGSSGQSTSTGGAGLTTSEMQGGEASTNMGGFDFASAWDTVLVGDSDASADGYPILQALDRTNQLQAQDIVFSPNPVIVDGVAYGCVVDGTQYSAELQ
jgi:hypothetical protein